MRAMIVGLVLLATSAAAAQSTPLTARDRSRVRSLVDLPLEEGWVQSQYPPAQHVRLRWGMLHVIPVAEPQSTGLGLVFVAERGRALTLVGAWISQPGGLEASLSQLVVTAGHKAGERRVSGVVVVQPRHYWGDCAPDDPSPEAEGDAEACHDGKRRVVGEEFESPFELLVGARGIRIVRD